MNPAFSLVFFTTLVGAGQGLCVVLALALLLQVDIGHGFVLQTLALAQVLLLAGLASSFLHLGNKLRAWRAVLMWRTSWMSREVIVLPAFIVLVAVWWLALRQDPASALSRGLAVLVVVGALLLWTCTAMIYACLRFVQEWAHPNTVFNFILIGLSSGLVLACALAVYGGQAPLLRNFSAPALALALAAWLVRALSLRRNARLVPRSTLQSATGIPSAKLVQKSMGMSAGSFNTREFFHRAPAAWMPMIQTGFQVLAFALPAACIAWGMQSGTGLPWLLAALLQAPGLVAERWYFFAQARHPQNLYYQTVS